MSWTSLKKILPEAVLKLNLGTVLEFNHIALKWDETLTDLFGDDFKNKTRPISLKGGVLLVDCLNSVWASELNFKKEPIRKYLNANFKKEIVKEIKFLA